MFKKILASSLLCMLFFNIFGTFPLFKFAQEMIRKEMAENIEGFLPESELEIIITSKDSHEIEWIRKGKEFKYNSEYYDVVKLSSQGDQHTYYCVKDLKETDLVGIMNYFIKKEREQNKDPFQSTNRKLAKIWYFENKIPQVITPETPERRRSLYTYYERVTPPFYLAKTTPPPQFFS